MSKTQQNIPITSASEACETCPVHHASNLHKLGVDMENWDYVIALAGNPNTGKSTVFNALTGLRQHTGNWPGKTVTRAEGGFAYAGARYKLVDLPGTYSLLASSPDEEAARNFLLFGQPDVTVVVVDATRLERNLNLALQVMEITDRVVICLNLMDEAQRLKLNVDARRLARDLGVPVVETAARSREGLDHLLEMIHEVASGTYPCKPHHHQGNWPELERATDQLVSGLTLFDAELPSKRWIALRLLDGDESIIADLKDGTLGSVDLLDRRTGSTASADRNTGDLPASRIDGVLAAARELRWVIGPEFADRLTESLYTDAASIADRSVTREGEKPPFDLDRTIDKIVTSRLYGFPIMILLLTVVFWLTIAGANIPSAWIYNLLLETIYPWLHAAAEAIGLPWWLSGILIDGIYRTTAWVVSVMLPPMAIFFPLFTLLEDSGYLPRVAFNLDSIFRKVGSHGKQSLSMSMGFGCNAAGVISTRIIDSPRERLVAIITNNFSLCNGRWPTMILLSTLFIGALVPAYLAGLVSALAVVGVTMLGILLTFAVSWGLTRTVLRGEVSTFSLELPPYRPPQVVTTIYTSLIDRTLFVLWRAVIFAAPVGAILWLSANITVGGISIAEYLVMWLNPIGLLLGLNGIILVAYLMAIPANEIVIPTILMLTVLIAGDVTVGEGAGVIFELNSLGEMKALLVAGGWTLLTAVNVMLFSLIHNPCSTTIYTIFKETGSRRWTTVSTLLPLVMGILVVFLVATTWRVLA